MITIETIKEELRAMIELAEKSSSNLNERDSDSSDYTGASWELAGPVECHGSNQLNDANFIARSRSMTPFACKALLMAIETLEKNVRWTEEGQAWWDGSSLTLNEIIKLWEEQK